MYNNILSVTETSIIFFTLGWTMLIFACGAIMVAVTCVFDFLLRLYNSFLFGCHIGRYDLAFVLNLTARISGKNKDNVWHSKIPYYSPDDKVPQEKMILIHGYRIIIGNFFELNGESFHFEGKAKFLGFPMNRTKFVEYGRLPNGRPYFRNRKNKMLKDLWETFL